MHKNDFFSLYIFFISLVFTQLSRTPNHFPLPRHWTRDRDFGPATPTLNPRPRLWTRDRDIGPATATLDSRPRLWTRDPRPATRDPRPATISQTPRRAVFSYRARTNTVMCSLYIYTSHYPIESLQ